MQSLRSLSLLLLFAGTLWAQPDKDALYTTPKLPSPDVLDRLNLKRSWSAFMRMEDRRDGILSFQFAPVRIAGKPVMRVLVQTRGGAIAEFDGETGQELWSTRAGNPNSAVHGLGFNEKEVAAVRGPELHGFSRKDGSLKWKLVLRAGPAATPLMDAFRLYVNLGTDSVAFFDLPTLGDVTPILARTYNSRIPMQLEPAQSERFLYFPSPRGSVAMLSKITSGLEARYETGDHLSAGPGVHEDDGGLYIGSRDANVYGFSMVPGEPNWRFTAGVPIERKPFVNDDDVIVNGEGKGLFRLHRRTLSGEKLILLLERRGLATRPQIEEVIGELKERAGDSASILSVLLRKGYLSQTQKSALRWRGGEEIWAAPEGDRMIAANPKFVYAMDRVGRMLVIGHDRGKVLSRFDMRDYPVGISNELTDRLYFAAHNGFILCLHDREYAAPKWMKSLIEPPGKEPKEPKDPKDPPKDPKDPKDPPPKDGAPGVKPEKP